MQKVNEIFGFSSPKELTTLDKKSLREKAITLANLYRDDLDMDELSVEIESFKHAVISSDNLAGNESKKNNYLSTTVEYPVQKVSPTGGPGLPSGATPDYGRQKTVPIASENSLEKFCRSRIKLASLGYDRDALTTIISEHTD
ncbi:hypothetical protein AVEN_49784-1 [Araneus ventricosus]|uniref:Uncharacterized protein n=1 Tax=Araneus ventricosus TaxID=182803 RepID=A0A4Y2QC52_ARAVE|nr:hypothetical protein AVEN_75117-1 [Araneus ventricosus]GBN60633.1 hypothetical protein AVEN_49784-1 [Araneus ventricosus]